MREPHYVVWDKEKIEAYWNVWGNLKPVSPWFGEKACGWMVEELRALTNKYFDGKKVKILDCGFGAGYLLGELSKRGFDCYGIDLSSERVHKAQLDHPNITFKVGSTTSTNFGDSFFDIVITTQTIEHFLDEDLQASFKEFSRIMAKRGLLFITTRFEEDLSREYKVCPDCHAIFRHSQHLQSFDFKRIKDLFNQVGIEAVILKRSRCRNNLKGVIPGRVKLLRLMDPILYRIFGAYLDERMGKYLYAVGRKFQ